MYITTILFSFPQLTSQTFSVALCTQFDIGCGITQGFRASLHNLISFQIATIITITHTHFSNSLVLCSSHMCYLVMGCSNRCFSNIYTPIFFSIGNNNHICWNVFHTCHEKHFHHVLHLLLLLSACGKRSSSVVMYSFAQALGLVKWWIKLDKWIFT